MLQFTTPQLGDPQKNKSAIAYQVRRHAAKVAAARQRKIHITLSHEHDNVVIGSALESCFLLNSHHALADDVDQGKKASKESNSTPAYRPKWTSVYRLQAPKTLTAKSTPTTPASPLPSPSSKESPSSDSVSNLETELSDSLDYQDALPWSASSGPFLENLLNPAQSDTRSNGVWDDEALTYDTLLTSRKHFPDTQASVFAFELGSGLREFYFLPPLLREAQRRAVCATVALDQFQRESAGAPLLEDIAEEAEQSQRAFQQVDIASSKSSTTEGLVAACCRLAGLIYCEIVLFPSLSQDEIASKLTGDLRNVLEAVDFWTSEDEVDSSVTNMLLWVTVMGAMMAMSETNSSWFTKRLSKMLNLDQKVRDWEGVRSVISTFLWWRPICDRPGRKVWEQARKFQQPGTARRPSPERRTRKQDHATRGVS